MIRRPYLAVIPALLLATALPARAAAPTACPPASDLDVDAAPLAHLAAALKQGATLNLLAVGSGPGPLPALPPAAKPAPPPASAPLKPSSNPPAQPSPAKPAPPAAPPSAKPPPPGPAAPPSLPGQTARALEAAIHGLHVTVTAIGRRGLTADAMLAPLRDELPKKPYRLVLWFTGTVDAVNGVPPEDFYEALADGAAAAANAGADLVLIDPQYSRFLEANANLAPYFAALQTAGALPGVVLFHRFDIMKDWAGNGALDLEHARKPDRPATAARLHACLGRELARMLLQDIAAAQ